MFIISRYVSWTAQKRWRSSLSHVTLSVPIYGLVYLISLLISLQSPNAIAATFVLAWWWSREKSQHEYRVKGGDSTYTVWHKGWLPTEWDRYSILDLALPAVVAVMFSILNN